jgi:YesN/AraC family two-component response regulator
LSRAVSKQEALLQSINNKEKGPGTPGIPGEKEKPKILVVEDNAQLREFIISSLGDPYDYMEAANGKEGAVMAEEQLPDIIISDIMMPEQDGIQMTRILKKNFSTNHIPIILLTAKATEESKLEGLQIGADDYITKPFNKTELELKVSNAITSRIKIREKLRLELFKTAPAIKVQSADEQFLAKVKDTIQSKLGDENLSVDMLAAEIGLSRAQFYRKVTALSGYPVNELIREFRLQKSTQLLNQKWGPVAQIAYEVGFSNPSYFSKCFKDRYGVMPSEYSSSKSNILNS